MEIDCPFRREFEAKFDAINKLIDIRTNYNEQALKVARDALEYRLEGMNEVREQLNRQAGTLVSKPELRAEVEKLELKIMPLVQLIATNEGSRKWTDYFIMVLISAFVVVLSKLLFYF